MSTKVGTKVGMGMGMEKENDRTNDEKKRAAKEEGSGQRAVAGRCVGRLWCRDEEPEVRLTSGRVSGDGVVESQP